MTSILEIKGDSLRIEGTVLIVSKLKVIPIVLETAGDDFFNICIQSGSITASVSRLGELLTDNDPPAGTTYTWEQISPDPLTDGNLSLTNTDKRTVNYEVLLDNFIDRTIRFYINKGQEDEQFDDVVIKGTPQADVRNINTKSNREGTLANLSTTLQFVSTKVNTTSANNINTKPNSVGLLENLSSTVPFVSVKNNTASANNINTKPNRNSTFDLHNLAIVLRRIGATTTGIQGQANTACDVSSWDLEWYHPATGTDTGTNTVSTFLNDYDLIDRWVVEEQTNGSNTWTQVLVKFPDTNPIKTDLRYSGTVADRKYRVIAYYKNIEFSQRLNAFVELSGEGRFTYRVSNYVTTPSSGYITLQGKSTETADMVININTNAARSGVLTNFSNTVQTNPNIGG